MESLVDDKIYFISTMKNLPKSISEPESNFKPYIILDD